MPWDDICPGLQDHRRWGLKVTSGDHLVQPSLLGQSHSEQVVQGLVQASLESVQRRRKYNLPGQPGPGPGPGFTAKKFLLLRRNFSGSSLCPLSLVLSMGTTEKSLANPFLTPLRIPIISEHIQGKSPHKICYSADFHLNLPK